MRFLLVLYSIFFAYSASAFREVHCPGPGRDFLVADPALVQHQGSLLIMGTGDILKYNSVSALLSAKPPRKKELRLFKEINISEKKIILPMAPGELPWDIQVYTIAGKEYLYGGVMTPPAGYKDARWPQDNISRRIKVATFDKNLKGWVFREAPVFGSPSHKSWEGHSYGHQLVQSRKKTYMLHEEISRDGITEIFLRKMITPFKAGPSIKLVGIENLPLHETERVHGGHLLEGPRYLETKVNGKSLHLIFFSTGDFPTKNYATRVAYSFDSILGPYKVFSGDLTQAAEDRGLYGVGRAFPFKHQGQTWIIFHGAKDIPGVDHTIWPENLDNFKRCLFVSPIEIKLIYHELRFKLAE